MSVTDKEQAISPEEVRRVARLARLRLTDEEVVAFSAQLSQILKHASKIKELDTSGIPPTSHPIRLANVWREDVPHTCLSPEVALSQAPHVENGMFSVPRILEAEE
ncbi:MAG: Asp-tRNA(Asn)/Glu-tRNA(Gln) amidotransferase subunit GatB [Acidimicrobiia bacterium]